MHREDHRQQQRHEQRLRLCWQQFVWITQHWNGGKGGGRNPGHGCAWHMEQDMGKVNATLKWGKRGVEENLLSLLRMAHRARYSNSQRKIRFPDYLSQGWTRILEVLILWTWVIHLKLRSRASYVNTSCHVCAWFMESSLHCICASYRGETYAGEVRITSRCFAVGPHKDLIRTSVGPQ